MDLKNLRSAISLGNIQWQRHSLEKMLERDVSRNEVIQTILNGEQIENYADDTPFPSGLFFAINGIRPIHVVVAFNSVTQTAFIITVYEPDLIHFESDFKTRRKL